MLVKVGGKYSWVKIWLEKPSGAAAREERLMPRRKISGWRDRAARFVLSILAGKRVAFWISEEAENTINDFAPMNVAGAGAAIVLAHALDEVEMTSATFTLTGFEITIRRTEPADPY